MKQTLQNYIWAFGAVVAGGLISAIVGWNAGALALDIMGAVGVTLAVIGALLALSTHGRAGRSNDAADGFGKFLAFTGAIPAAYSVVFAAALKAEANGFDGGAWISTVVFFTLIVVAILANSAYTAYKSQQRSSEA